VRLGQAKEAPSRVTWGRYNRKALVRLPAVARDEDGVPTSPETVEFRLPDGSAHPHLLLAAVAQAMVAARGIDVEAILARTAAGPGTDTAAPVPRSFGEVAESLRAHRAMLEAGGVFPSHVVGRVLDGLQRE
jgi:glutamine synthetase